MKKYIFWVVFAMLVGLNSYAAEIQTYKTSEEFLKAEWETCKIASDWCNQVWIENSKLWATTLMACLDNAWNPLPEEWSCLDQKLLEEKLSSLSQEEKDLYIKYQENLWDEISNKVEEIVNNFWTKVLKLKNYNIENSSIIVDLAIARFDETIKTLWDSKQDNMKSEILNLAKIELKIMKDRWKKNTVIN